MIEDTSSRTTSRATKLPSCRVYCLLAFEAARNSEAKSEIIVVASLYLPHRQRASNRKRKRNRKRYARRAKNEAEFDEKKKKKNGPIKQYDEKRKRRTEEKNRILHEADHEQTHVQVREMHPLSLYIVPRCCDMYFLILIRYSLVDYHIFYVYLPI